MADPPELVLMQWQEVVHAVPITIQKLRKLASINSSEPPWINSDPAAVRVVAIRVAHSPARFICPHDGMDIKPAVVISHWCLQNAGEPSAEATNPPAA